MKGSIIILVYLKLNSNYRNLYNLNYSSGGAKISVVL